jgi:hypothetical protein
MLILQGEGHPNEHEPQGAAGLVYRKSSGNKATAGTTCNDGCLKMDRFYEG